MRDLQSGGSPTTSDPLDLSPTESKYSPWAVSESAKTASERCRGVMEQLPRVREPTPAQIELLLKTYWLAIHPVCIILDSRFTVTDVYIVALAYTLQAHVR